MPNYIYIIEYLASFSASHVYLSTKTFLMLEVCATGGERPPVVWWMFGTVLATDGSIQKPWIQYLATASFPLSSNLSHNKRLS